MSTKPSESPSASAKPSSQPSGNPSQSDWPTSQPSMNPSISGKPSSIPSESPSVSAKPSSQPSENPSISVKPSNGSNEPSASGMPSASPSSGAQVVISVITSATANIESAIAGENISGAKKALSFLDKVVADLADSDLASALVEAAIVFEALKCPVPPPELFDACTILANAINEIIDLIKESLDSTKNASSQSVAVALFSGRNRNLRGVDTDEPSN